MSKHIEKLKKQLTEIAEVVNAFKSEAVQLKVVDKLLDVLVDFDKADIEGADFLIKKVYKKTDETENYPFALGRKKPGATKVLNQLLGSDFFHTARSISSIAEYCKENFDSDFKTSELSGILLKLANEHKLKRERSKDNNRFEYVAV
jgi:cysteinyl-tRNA synthetase